MKTNVFLGIGIRIILLFSVGMLATYIPDNLRDFFGDKLHDCSASIRCDKNWCVNSRRIDNLYDWGARHYWYFIMMILLFILSLVNVIVGIVNLVEKIMTYKKH